MTQHDFNIANASGAAVRADLNTALQAIAENNSGATEPATMFANQWWFDTANNLLKIRNAANTAWVTVAEKNGNNWTPYRLGVALGTASVKNTGTSGDAVPLLNTDNAWSGENHFTTQTDTSSSGAVTFDFSDGNICKITLTENITSITLTGTSAGGVYEIWITQHASAAKTVSGWPASVKPPGGTAFVMSTTVGAVDVVTLRYDGTIYAQSFSQDHR